MIRSCCFVVHRSVPLIGLPRNHWPPGLWQQEQLAERLIIGDYECHESAVSAATSKSARLRRYPPVLQAPYAMPRNIHVSPNALALEVRFHHRTKQMMKPLRGRMRLSQCF